MKAKTTSLNLLLITLGVEVPFEFSHAERLLNIKNSGWALPETSKFVLENGKLVAKKQPRGGDSDSDTPTSAD
jgi:hypothetical protein